MGQKAKSPVGGVRIGTPGYHHYNRGYHRGPYLERRMYRERNVGLDRRRSHQMIGADDMGHGRLRSKSLPGD